MSRGALTRGMHVQPKEEVQQDVIEQVTEAMQWQREAAAEADLTMHEFHELNTTYQEAALSDMVQEIGDKMGVDAGQVLSTAVMFTDRTRADAERVGMEHDEYLGAICEVRPSPPLRCWNDALTPSLSRADRVEGVSWRGTSRARDSRRMQTIAASAVWACPCGGALSATTALRRTEAVEATGEPHLS